MHLAAHAVPHTCPTQQNGSRRVQAAEACDTMIDDSPFMTHSSRQPNQPPCEPAFWNNRYCKAVPGGSGGSEGQCGLQEGRESRPEMTEEQ